jgi:anti-anti-sigma regulatory factor
MITEQHDTDTLTFKLAGMLAKDWAIEFKRCWHDTISSSKNTRIIVDLSEVTFVDDIGKDLLSSMIKRGAELIALDILMKSIVEEVVKRSAVE